MTLAERLKAEGHAEGQAEGRIVTLRKQLALKFGPLSAENQTRLARATEPEIDRWTEQVLFASSLDM